MGIKPWTKISGVVPAALHHAGTKEYRPSSLVCLERVTHVTTMISMLQFGWVAWGELDTHSHRQHRCTHTLQSHTYPAISLIDTHTQHGHLGYFYFVSFALDRGPTEAPDVMETTRQPVMTTSLPSYTTLCRCI